MISWLKHICFLLEPSDKTIILLNAETQAKQVPTNYSHQIAEKVAMSENKTVYRGRGGQISTPFIGGHRAGVSCVKIGVQTIFRFMGMPQTKVSQNQNQKFLLTILYPMDLEKT